MASSSWQLSHIGVSFFVLVIPCFLCFLFFLVFFLLLILGLFCGLVVGLILYLVPKSLNATASSLRGLTIL